MLLGTSRGAYISILWVFVQPPRGYFGSFNRNIVGIIYPIIWPLGGLQGYWGFSGNAIYTYTRGWVAPCQPLGFLGFYLSYKILIILKVRGFPRVPVVLTWYC